MPPAAELERFIGPPLIDAFAELAGPERVGACLAAYRERYVLVERSRRPRSCRARAEALAAVAAQRAGGGGDDQAARVRRAAVRAPRAGAVADRRRAARSSTPPRRSRPSRSRRALEALGLAPGADAPLVGDRSHDAEAARANGIRCVGVLWGIGDEAELRAAGADPIVADPAASAARLRPRW